jgi:DNA repair protein RecO (recombination protein O)
MGLSHTDSAIILRRTRFSETSLILTCLTVSQGKVKISARGALRPHSPLSGRLDLCHITRLVWAPSRRSDLHPLREAEILHAFVPNEPAHVALMAAAYFCALAEAVTSPGEPCAELFHLLERALGYLGRQSPDRRALRHFEKELASLLGILDPQADSPVLLLGHYIGSIPSLRDELWPMLPERRENTSA